MMQQHAQIVLPVPLKLQTLLLGYYESGSIKAIVLNTGWLCTCSNIDIG